MPSVHQIQHYLRESARQRYDVVAVPPFTIFLQPLKSDIHANYAIPDTAMGGDLQAPLEALRKVFAEHRRFPRFEFIEGFAPELAPALQRAGFVEEERTVLMICTPETYQPAPHVPGLVMTRLTNQSPLADVRALITVQQQAFEDDHQAVVTDEDAKYFLQWLTGSTFFLAKLNDQPVGAGSLLPPLDGVAEVAGIGTLSAFRRRGIAAAVTAAAANEAFDQRVGIAFLTAADENAGRVYERVGFRPFATTLAYSDLDLQ